MQLDTYYGETDALDEPEIPLAESPDLISALLDFDASELAGTEQLPEELLIKKACALRRWSVRGKHPKFLVHYWIEVVVTGRLQGSCRIINSRTHTALQPFTLDRLIKEVESLSAWVENYKTPPDFVKRLLAAYDELSESSGQDVSLQALYRLLNSRQPHYRRECFGIDLSRCISDLPVVHNRRVRLLRSEGPLTERYLVSPAQGMPPRSYNRIEIGPDTSEELQSLDI